MLAVALVSLTPTLPSLVSFTCFRFVVVLFHTFVFFRPQLPARTFTDDVENHEQWRDCARQILGMVSARRDGLSGNGQLTENKVKSEQTAISRKSPACVYHKAPYRLL